MCSLAECSISSGSALFATIKNNFQGRKYIIIWKFYLWPHAIVNEPFKILMHMLF